MHCTERVLVRQDFDLMIDWETTAGFCSRKNPYDISVTSIWHRVAVMFMKSVMKKIRRFW